MQKLVNAKTKTLLRSSTIVCNLDICCPKGHCPFHIIFSKIQTQKIKKSKPKEFRAKNPKPAPTRDNIEESVKKKIKKIRRKSFGNKNKSKINKLRLPTSTLLKLAQKKYFYIPCYNYDEKDHYTKSCPKSPKNQCQF